jgi:hypothetical protein
VHLANTAAIQQYEGLKYTDDDSDARWLAHMLRLGVLPEGYLPETGAGGQGSFAQAKPAGQAEDSECFKHPESLLP